MDVARKNSPADLVLASKSPRRRSLLEQVGFSVEILGVDLDESPQPGEDAVRLARRLAAQKAEAAARSVVDRVVLAADTVVAVGDRLLGKPIDRSEAREMLRELSGRWHEVVTGVAIRTPSRTLAVSHSLTRVRFANLSDEEIVRYSSGDEPYDKAGAYALQGIAGWFIVEIAGSPTNVVGLPMEIVRVMLLEAGVPLPRLGRKP